MTLRFDPVRVSDADTLVGLARDFHHEDGHPLTAAREAALRQIALGEPFARAWLMREYDAIVGYLRSPAGLFKNCTPSRQGLDHNTNLA